MPLSIPHVSHTSLKVASLQLVLWGAYVWDTHAFGILGGAYVWDTYVFGILWAFRLDTYVFRILSVLRRLRVGLLLCSAFSGASTQDRIVFGIPWGA